MGPELVRGVPLDKIGPGHPYWSADWEPPEDFIRPRLKDHQERLESVKRGAGKGQGKHVMFMVQRQVHRGLSVLNFLQTGDVHPYQLVGKRWFSDKSLRSYDTIYRLVATLEELSKFDIDVTPAEWLRQRLHERYAQNPTDFRLEAAVRDMYHDAKLTELRAKNGFVNIGRPARTKTPRRKKGGKGGAPPPPSESPEGARAGAGAETPPRKPKGTPGAAPGHTGAPPTASATATATAGATSGKKRKVSAMHDSGEGEDADTGGNSGSSGGGRWGHSEKRRFAHFVAVPDEVPDSDLEYDGYTSTDSFSQGNVTPYDWRVVQVRIPNVASSTVTTQYWHWLEAPEHQMRHRKKAGGPRADRQGAGPQHDGGMFEHQVLRDVDPDVSWGVYKDPTDLHLRLGEITQITCASDSLKIIVGTQPYGNVQYRGDVLGRFKRERTKRRFLSFLRDRGVKMVNRTA